MQVIPLKKKYQLTEQDIDDLSRLLAEGASLEHMTFFFQDRLTSEQIYMMAGILANEMYEMPLSELCPHLAEQRRAMNSERNGVWQKHKMSTAIVQLLKEINEDLNYYELELLSRKAVN